MTTVRLRCPHCGKPLIVQAQPLVHNSIANSGRGKMDAAEVFRKGLPEVRAYNQSRSKPKDT